LPVGRRASGFVLVAYWLENARPLADFFKETKLRHITAAQVAAHQNARTEVGRAPKTINGELSVLEFEHRISRADGEYRWFQSRGLPLRDGEGRIVRWYNLLTDIDARRQSEEKLRRSEADLLEAQRLSHAGSWRHDLGSGAFTVSPEVLRIRGVESAEPLSTIDRMYSGIHPDDRTRVRETYEAAQKQKGEFDAEYRIVLRDGTIKHLHTIGHPVLNESGDVVEYVGTGMDVTEQREAQAALENAFEEIKRLKDRLQDENLALREEIDQAFMFEEIVGASPALKSVLSHVSKVAPTDSTVLISGETGTGKELIRKRR